MNATPSNRISKPSSSSLSSRRSPKLTLDLSCIPKMSQPTPITNTLLITGLDNPETFSPANLDILRARISQIARINTWSPLRSFRRIMVSFTSVEDAKVVRHRWDGDVILGQRVRVFYGMHTPLADAAGPSSSRLALPDAGKLFFISPPPSPPVGWEVRLEDAPNKQVHADDLAEALAKLNQAAPGPSDVLMLDDSPVTPVDAQMQNEALERGRGGKTHARSGSATLIWLPEQHGHSPEAMIPAISIEDMCDPESMSISQTKINMTHTMRPPVELMEQ
ncbi:hypothetical protein TD95_000016 [Thielaviopsis punctulata]|uniref:Calcipressin n=1 Tax=Thielaviopsis punctulata TaxID=72032 RepID=A0A0F4Z8U7_9PEZI|nr:hypothetical protein TD95_000016 [Thielaviopsis punctulata]